MSYTYDELVETLKIEIETEKLGYKRYLGLGNHTSKDYEDDIAYREALLNLIIQQKEETEQWKEEANRYQNLWCEAQKTIYNSRIYYP